jgi:hypothetical protein
VAVRGAAAYSPVHRSKTYLVYTTEDLRVRFVDRTHFFGRAYPEKRAYAQPIGKVGLARERPTEKPGYEKRQQSRHQWATAAGRFARIPGLAAGFLEQ